MMAGHLNAHDLQLTYTIHYPENADTIFFIHGNSSSSGNWRKQVASPLLESFRLITIDLPSHGNAAEMPADADFSLPALANIMADAITQLNNQQPYIICAVSLGTNIAVETLLHGLKPNGLLLAGPCIAGKGFELDKMIKAGADPTPVFIEDAAIERVIRYAMETSNSMEQEDTEFFLNDYYKVKGKFRSSLFATIAAANYNDEVELLGQQNLPVCLVFGKDEMVINTGYLNDAPINLWHNTIYKLAHASHLVNIDAPMAFNQLLAEFAADMFEHSGQ